LKDLFNGRFLLDLFKISNLTQVYPTLSARFLTLLFISESGREWQRISERSFF